MKINNKVTRTQKMERFLKEIMQFFNCDTLTIIGEKWYGEYGRVVYMSKDNIEINKWENLRRIYKVAHAIWNNTAIEQDDRVAVDTYWNGPGTLVLLNNATCIDGGSLYKLSNGQLFDAFGSHWFDMHDSKRLKKMLKGGYQYYSPQVYYEDIAEKSEKEIVYAFSEEGYEE